MALRLNDLRLFLETASSRTMSESARRLGITQPALSESIRRLEDDTGSPLFYRAKSGIALTPQGRRILEKAKSVMGLINEMESEHESALPTIVIGAHPLVASYSLPTALANLQKLEPAYRISVENAHSRQVQEWIQQGRVDVGLVVNPVSNPDLIIRTISKDKIAVWMHKGGALNEQILYNPEMFQAQTILRQWKKRPEQLMSLGSLELIVRLTSARLGYGILPTRAVELMHAPLVRAPHTPEYQDQICLVYRPEFGKSTYEKQILESLLASLS